MTLIEPLKQLLVVERDAIKDQSDGGILLPDDAKQKPQVGTIVAMGPDVRDLNVGDRIMFKRYAATDVEFDGQEATMVDAADVMARLGSASQTLRSGLWDERNPDTW